MSDPKTLHLHITRHGEGFKAVVDELPGLVITGATMDAVMQHCVDHPDFADAAIVSPHIGRRR
jgi:hypothetical protein